MGFPSGLEDREMHVESGGGSGLRVAFRQELSNGAGLRVRYKSKRDLKYFY